MSEQSVELNLGKVLMAILKRYEKVEVSPQALLEEVDESYQLRIDFNDETEMFEITLEEPDAS
jgi:hypothetical protein